MADKDMADKDYDAMVRLANALARPAINEIGDRYSPGTRLDQLGYQFGQGGPLPPLSAQAAMLPPSETDQAQAAAEAAARRLSWGQKPPAGRADGSEMVTRALSGIGQLGADFLIPQTPLDVALMLAGGPFGKLAKTAAVALGAALTPTEAEAGVLGKVTTAARDVISNAPARRYVHSPQAATLASRSAKMDNPEAQKLRPFEADYPGAVPTDESGRLTRTSSGHTIQPTATVVGRRVVGGEDQAFPQAQFDALTAALTGRESTLASLGRLVGSYEKRPITRSDWESLTPREQSGHSGFTTGIFLDRRLSPSQTPLVHSHEIGHAISDRVGTELIYKPTKYGRKIPFRDIPVTEEMQPELEKIYRDLNRGKLPTDFKYRGDDIRSELIAEAIRAYKADPNYIKSVAPNTAKQIQSFVNGHPEISKIIQFNSLGAGAVPLANALMNDGSESR